MKVLQDILIQPNHGVFTVHTGGDRKDASPASKSQWMKTLTSLSSKKPMVLAIPSDTGGGIQRGANWGPWAIRKEISGLKKTYADLGDVRVNPHLLHDKYLNSETIKQCQRAMYGKVNKLPVSPLSIAEKALSVIYKSLPDARVLGLGGDHSTSFPLVSEWIRSRKAKKKAGLLHFDAHTDLLESRMGIDLCFGTWTFQVLKLLSSPSHLVQLGIRSSGKDKKHWKKTLGVEQIWAQEVEIEGAQKIYVRIREHFKKIHVEELYISFDIDALDLKYAAATGTPEKGGLLPPDCSLIIRLLSQDFKITGADLMEVAPHVLPDGVEVRDQRASLSVAGDVAKILLEVLGR